MKFNDSMKRLLTELKIHDIDSIPLDFSYPIKEKQDTIGRSYYTVSDFWGLDKEGVTPGRDLTELEWDGNEIYLDAKTKDKTADIIIKTIGIFKAWRSELEQSYPSTRFNMLAYYDNGEQQELNEGETPTHSMTFRLWAERGNASSFASANAEQWKQPAISEFCNY